MMANTDAIMSDMIDFKKKNFFFNFDTEPREF